jgi:preprotein translocase subunit SecE
LRLNRRASISAKNSVAKQWPHPGSPDGQGPDGGVLLRGLVFVLNGLGDTMAKTSASEFVNQVQAEAKKIVWPTSRETIMTAVMVVLMTSILGLFFFGIDTFFGAIVRWLLTFAAGQA